MIHHKYNKIHYNTCERKRYLVYHSLNGTINGLKNIALATDCKEAALESCYEWIGEDYWKGGHIIDLDSGERIHVTLKDI